MLPGLLTGYVIRAGGGWSGELLIADCGDLEKLVSFRYSRPAVQAPGVAQEGKLLFPCADGSVKLFDLPQHPCGEMPATGNPEEKTVNTFGAW